MRLGLGPMGLNLMTRSQLVSLATRAVASSFDAVWLDEARAQGVGGGLAAAAMVAQAVPIRVGAAVDAGLYHPLHLAEDIAIADLTSQGRIEVLLRLDAKASARYGTPAQRGWLEEHVQVLAAALSGAHIQWSGEHLRVPARIGANQPTPERLALNPRPAQPVVPIWLAASETWTHELAYRLGFGVAVAWTRGGSVPAASGRWPGMLLCPPNVDPNDLLTASGEGAGYFLVAAETADEVTAAGRRLAGPVRMPDFPAWIMEQQ